MNAPTRIAPPLESENAGIKLLAIEVISTALKDAKSTSLSKDARDARSFLTDEIGGWAQSRAFWCALADFDPDALREGVIEKWD